jgi:hypothetical protein
MHPRVTGSLGTAEKEPGQAIALGKRDVNLANAGEERGEEKKCRALYCSFSIFWDVARVGQWRYPGEEGFPWIDPNARCVSKLRAPSSPDLLVCQHF